jgi:hypothetical protein
VSINLSSAQAYIIARQSAKSALECKEKGVCCAKDPDKALQDLRNREVYSRVHDCQENGQSGRTLQGLQESTQ